MISRNVFLKKTVMASAGAAFLSFDILKNSAPNADELITFDLHAHPGQFYRRGLSTYPGDQVSNKTVSEMNTVGFSGAFFSLVVDTLVTKVTPKGVVPAREFEKGEAWKEYKRQLNEFKIYGSTLPLRFCSTVNELKARSSKKVAGFLACEGGDFLESGDQLDEMYEDGVRAVQLVHYAPNPLGDLQTSASMHNGLSSIGKEVVRKMNQVGMVIDVAHASQKTVQDVAELTDAPIILSHSILKLEEERPISARAISESHAKLVAGTGGVIGAWPSGFSTSFDDYVNNILRLIDVVGIDHVGLGTDMDSNFKPVLDSYLQLPKLMEALTSKGLGDEDVNKIVGGNAVRVLNSVLKA